MLGFDNCQDENEYMEKNNIKDLRVAIEKLEEQIDPFNTSNNYVTADGIKFKYISSADSVKYYKCKNDQNER